MHEIFIKHLYIHVCDLGRGHFALGILQSARCHGDNPFH